MPDPWDVPPFPDHGDENAESTYQMVGYALSRWEEVELALSALYAVFAGKPGQYAAQQQYGVPRIFDHRLKGLRDAAEEFFKKHCHQAIEGEFERVADLAQKFSARRNDFAHSVVRPIQWVRPLYFLDQYQGIIGAPAEYALVPPHYTQKKFDAQNMPKYVYVADQIQEIALEFVQLTADLIRLRERLVAALQP